MPGRHFAADFSRRLDCQALITYDSYDAFHEYLLAAGSYRA